MGLFANEYIARSLATVSGPFSPENPWSKGPSQPPTTSKTEVVSDKAENKDDDDQDVGLPEGFESLNIDDEDEFDRSWL